MLTFIPFDPIRFDPSSDIYQEKNTNEPVNLLVEIARNEKVKCIALMISPENETMQNICQKLGFGLSPSTEIGMIEAMIEF